MEKIIREILDGNKEKFREIVRKYNADFLRIAFHFAGDWDDAKDITQTTLIRTYRFLYKFKLDRAFEPWIYRIHLNNCKSAARRLKWSRTRRLPLKEETLVTEGIPESAPVNPLVFKQILSLSPKQKAAFILVEIEGVTQKDAALKLGCGESTLRVHLARAKENLRRKLRLIGVNDEF